MKMKNNIPLTIDAVEIFDAACLLKKWDFDFDGLNETWHLKREFSISDPILSKRDALTWDVSISIRDLVYSDKSTWQAVLRLVVAKKYYSDYRFHLLILNYQNLFE